MKDNHKDIYRSEEYILQAMKKWGTTVFVLALAQTTSRVDAEDIHQEVFIRLLKNTISFNDDEHLKAWLLRVTINCCHDFAKSRDRKSTRLNSSH